MDASNHGFAVSPSPELALDPDEGTRRFEGVDAKRAQNVVAANLVRHGEQGVSVSVEDAMGTNRPTDANKAVRNLRSLVQEGSAREFDLFLYWDPSEDWVFIAIFSAGGLAEVLK